MKMSAKGRALLTQREGVRLKAYKDSVGVWTIGIGHTSAAGPPNVTPGLTLTREEVDRIFARDLVQYERAVDKAVTVPMSQHEFDALVSFCYNVGTGGLAKSTVVKKLNAGDNQGAADALLLWNKPPEIMGRRKQERLQFLTPYDGEVPAPPDVEPPEEEEPAKKDLTKWLPGLGGLGGLGTAFAWVDTTQEFLIVACFIIAVAAGAYWFFWGRKRD